MYPVSEAFLRAVQENTRRYHWTGRITTRGGAVYPLGYEDLVKGSGYISTQCCGSAEIELGTVFVWEFMPSQGNGTIAAVALTSGVGFRGIL